MQTGMMRVAVVVLCLSVSGLLAQPVPAGDKNSTMEHGSPLNLEASKIVESGVAETVLSYGRPAYAPNYESRSYSSPYPTSTCHGHAHGYYGNPAHGCKIFHICQEDGRLETFDCPPYTKFNNYLLVCDWPHKVDHNCDPVYKDEEYPPQSYNNAYPMDKTYVPNFMNLYPVKPAYNPLAYTPIIPAFAKGYTPAKAYAPYVPEYNPYNKVEVYPKTPAVYAVHEKQSYKPYAEKAYDYPVDKVNYQVPKPHYAAEKMMYEKPVAYPLDKPVYDRPAVYPMEKPMYEKPAYEKQAYPMERPVYEKSAAYPIEKPVYNIYPLDKPAYPIEKQPYVAPYPMEKPVYVQYDKPAYNSAYPHQSPEYTIIVDKIVYSVEKPAYEKVIYPMDKPVYEKSAYEKPAYHMEKPAYEKPAYEKPIYPMEKPVYDKPAYERPVYPVERPAYDRPAYEKPVYDRPAYEKPVYDKPAYEKPVYDRPAYEKPVYDKPAYDKPQYNIYALEKPSYNAYPEKTAYPMERPVSYPETKVLYPLPQEKPAYQPEKPAYHERPMYKEYVTKPIYKPSDYEKDLYKPDYQEKSYVLPLFPYNTYAAEYPSYDRLNYKQDKYPTVASYANYMKSYNNGPYEPQYGYAPVPYVSYRTKLAGLLKY